MPHVGYLAHDSRPHASTPSVRSTRPRRPAPRGLICICDLSRIRCFPDAAPSPGAIDAPLCLRRGDRYWRSPIQLCALGGGPGSGSPIHLFALAGDAGPASPVIFLSAAPDGPILPFRCRWAETPYVECTTREQPTTCSRDVISLNATLRDGGQNGHRQSLTGSRRRPIAQGSR